MADTEKNFDNAFAAWQQNGFSPWWSYSYINNSAFYASIPAPFQQFMRRYVQYALWWNDGWCPYFHNAHDGIFSTGIGGALVKRLADKVFGSKLYFKNDSTDEEVIDPTTVKANPSLLAFNDWDKRVRFSSAIYRAIANALAAGTSAVKVNRNRRGELWADAWRFDKFFPVVNGDGSIEKATFKILLNIPFEKNTATEQKTTYTLEETRYFGDYTRLDGTVLRDVPLCEYQVQKMYGSVTNGVYQSDVHSERVCWRDLPKSVKKYITNNYPDFRIDEPALLPFDSWLGVELFKATEFIPSLPELPFGESILHKIIPHLESFDYAFSAMCTDMYIGKGRVLVPKGIAGATGGEANSGLNSFIYEKMEYVDPENQKPVPLQFEIRTSEWKTQFENILNLIAVNIGISPATIASFLQDNSPRTAREVSTQENETMQFVTSTRAVIEPALNNLINHIRLYMGLEDKISVRWSYAGMENPYINAETISLAKSGGFISRWKAIQRFNYDDNDVQLAQEYMRILEDEKNSNFGNSLYAEDERVPYFGEQEQGGGEVNDDNAVT